MKRSKWFIIGIILAVVFGFLLFEFWNLIAGIVAAIVMLSAFGALSIWCGDESDEDEEDDGDDDDDKDDEED